MACSMQNCSTISVKLDETNYPIWAFLMHHHLRGHGFLKFIDGSHLCPAEFLVGSDGSLINNSAARQKWMEQDSLVIFMISTALSADALTLIIGCQTSMEVWFTLKQRYAIVSESHIMKLKVAIHNIQKGYDSVDRYLLHFKYLRDRLAVAGVEMNDTDAKLFILAGLPSDYGHTRQIIRGKHDIAMDEVRTLLLSAEYEIEMRNRASIPMVAQNSMIFPKGYTCSPSLTNFGYHSGCFNASLSNCYGQQCVFQPSDLSVPNEFVCNGVVPSLQNVLFSQLHGMPESSACTNEVPFCVQVPSTLPDSCYDTFIHGKREELMNNNMKNEGRYNSGPSHSQQQQLPAINLDQVSQNVQTRFQHNCFMNSFSYGGHTEDNMRHPNFLKKGVKASAYFVECQICRRPGHYAESCNHGQPQVAPKENEDSTPVSAFHVKDKKIEALSTTNTRPFSSNVDRNLLNCRQAAKSSSLWRSLPLMPPG